MVSPLSVNAYGTEIVAADRMDMGFSVYHCLQLPFGRHK